MCIYKEIYFWGLAHTIMESGKSKICVVGWQIEDPGRSPCWSARLKAVCYRIPSCLEKVSSCYVKAFNRLDMAHPFYRGRAICFIQSVPIQMLISFEKHPPSWHMQLTITVSLVWLFLLASSDLSHRPMERVWAYKKAFSKIRKWIFIVLGW